MTKRILHLIKGEYGFAHTEATLRPVEKRYQRDGDAYPQFMDINVKQLLDNAKQTGGFVMLVNETPTTYSSQHIHACPECGWPMRRQGRGAKNDPRYVCPRAEAAVKYDLPNRTHAYVRAWSEEELKPPVEDAPSKHVDGPFASLRDMRHESCPCGCGFKGVCETQLALVQSHDAALEF